MRGRHSLLIQEIERHNFGVVFLDDTSLARVDWDSREIRIGAQRGDREVIDSLIHELRHVEDPGWECGL